MKVCFYNNKGREDLFHNSELPNKSSGARNAIPSESEDCSHLSQRNISDSRRFLKYLSAFSLGFICTSELNGDDLITS